MTERGSVSSARASSLVRITRPSGSIPGSPRTDVPEATRMFFAESSSSPTGRWWARVPSRSREQLDPVLLEEIGDPRDILSAPSGFGG